MPNFTYDELPKSGNVSEASKLPPGASAPRSWSQGRRLPSYMSNEPPFRHPRYTSKPPAVSGPRISRPEWQAQGMYHEKPYLNGQRSSSYVSSWNNKNRTPPPCHRPAAFANSYSPIQYPQNRGRSRGNHHVESYYSPKMEPSSLELWEECSDLKIVVDSLNHENEDLKHELEYQVGELREQLKINEKQSIKLEEQSEELQKLKSKMTSLNTEVAVKDSKINELKGKNEVYIREAEGKQDGLEKLEKRAKLYAKEIEEKRLEMENAVVELAKRQKQIVRQKQELENLRSENKNGRAQMADLKAQKQKIRQELQACRFGKGGNRSLQSTLKEAVEFIHHRDKTIEGLVLNISMQKIEYDAIIDYFISSYRDLRKDFRRLQDTCEEVDELKQGTINLRFEKQKITHPPVRDLCMACRPRFVTLETLTDRFQILSADPIYSEAIEEVSAKLKAQNSK